MKNFVTNISEKSARLEEERGKGQYARGGRAGGKGPFLLTSVGFTYFPKWGGGRNAAAI